MTQLLIRHSEISDAPHIKAIYEQPHVYKETLQLPYTPDKLWEQRINDLSENAYSLVAESEREIAGHLHFYTYPSPRRRHAGSFALAVKDRWLRKGVANLLMQELLNFTDNWLNIKRVELEVYTDNSAAIKLYEKWGFASEGVAKNFAFRDGKYADVVRMARIIT